MFTGRAAGSLLAVAFSESLQLNADGCVFIDRDPDLVAGIIFWLRTGKVNCESFTEIELLRDEAEHFQVYATLATTLHGCNSHTHCSFISLLSSCSPWPCPLAPAQSAHDTASHLTSFWPPHCQQRQTDTTLTTLSSATCH